MNPALQLLGVLALVTTMAAVPALAVDAVVGSGTSASCDESDFDTALGMVQTSGGGTITFNCGGQHIINFSSARTISSPVVIDGGSMITLSGNNATRLFIVASGVGASFGLRNITLTKGFAPTGDGGAIANGNSEIDTGGTLHLTDVVFQDNHTSSEGGSGGAVVSYGPVNSIDSRFEGNSAANGGAVYLRFGAAVGTFTNTAFKDNSTLSATNGWGGAILLWDGARLTVRGCDFESNSARFGGAIHNQFANVETTIEQATIFRSNTASAQGGALWLQAGSTQVDKSLLLENVAVFGAGIYQGGGTLTVADSTIASNVAQQGGGGLKIRGGVATLRGTTLAGNTTNGAGLGAGISVRSLIDTQLSLLNSTLSGNSGWYGPAIWALKESGDAIIDLRYVTISANVSTENRAVVDIIGDVQLNLVSTVLSGNHAHECLFSPGTESFRTARFSLWSDTSCSFGTSEQNHPNIDAALGPLADNGGWTLTHLPLSESPLIDNGSCLAGVTTDQRGASRLHGLACDIGAVEAGSVIDDSLFADGFEAAKGWSSPTGVGLTSSPARSP